MFSGIAGACSGRVVADSRPAPSDVVQVMPCALSQARVLAVPGQGAVHDLGVQLPDVVVADAEAIARARTEALEEDVGAARQAQDHLASLGAFEIPHDRAT